MPKPYRNKEIQVPTLEKEQVRPLTVREVSSILGALMGGMVSNGTPVDVVREAVSWWAGNDQTWELMQSAYEAEQGAGQGEPKS